MNRFHHLQKAGAQKWITFLNNIEGRHDLWKDEHPRLIGLIEVIILVLTVALCAAQIVVNLYAIYTRDWESALYMNALAFAAPQFQMLAVCYLITRRWRRAYFTKRGSA